MSLAACLLLLTGCSMPGDAAPVVKIGLIAPFEGLGRPLGYAVLPAVKAAMAEANAGGKLGPYRVALVALDDSLDPHTAAAQADALAQDPDVIAVLGPFESATAQAVAPALAHAGIPTLLAAPLADPPDGVRSLCPSPDRIAASQDDVARGAGGLSSYTGDAVTASDELTRRHATGERGALVGGPDLLRPWLIGRAGPAAEGSQAAACLPDGMSLSGAEGAGEDASLAYQAALADYGTQAILAALSTDIAAHGRPTRSGVAAALSQRPIVSGPAWYRVENGAWEEQN